jgi:hypothetical protein
MTANRVTQFGGGNSGGSSALPLNAIQLGNGAGGFKTVAGTTLDVTGNARGTGALDIQSVRSAVTQVASGFNAFALGLREEASGDSSLALGTDNVAAGTSAYAIGAGNTASIAGDVAIGGGNTAQGGASTAIGVGNTVFGSGAMALGRSCIAFAANCIAMGISIANFVANSLEIGASNAEKVRIDANGVNSITAAGYYLRNGVPIFNGILAATGTVNGSNTVFTFAYAPQIIVVDGGKFMQQTSSDGTVNWTGTTTITLTVAPNFDIFGI